jgi:hypothetical protein
MRRMVFTQPIARPAELIWGFLSDLCNDRRWRQEIQAVELVSGTRGGAPATYRETVEWRGLKADATLTVTEAVEGRYIVILSEGKGYTSRSNWRFEPHSTGTLVSLVFSLETSGAVHLAEPVMWEMVTGWLERDLPMLEGHLKNLSATDGPHAQQGPLDHQIS